MKYIIPTRTRVHADAHQSVDEKHIVKGSTHCEQMKTKTWRTCPCLGDGRRIGLMVSFEVNKALNTNHISLILEKIQAI